MMVAEGPAKSDVRVRWLRATVLGVAVLTTGFKLLIAATTFGTIDVHYWMSFAQGAREFGPVDMYGHEYLAQYNHPPMSGWMLVAINWLVDHDVANFPFLIRMPASVADLVSVLLIFELVRLSRPVVQAAIAAALVACSPALIVISGFHGNTDSVLVMFSLLSIYLLVVKRWATAAGLAFAAAVSVKLVPLVLGPVLVAFLVRQGWRKLAAFTGGAGVVFALLWGPVLLSRWPEFNKNVLGYASIPREWGLAQFVTWAGAPRGVVDYLAGPGRFGVLALCAAIPAVIVWRRPNALPPAAGLSLAMFLLLSPAFGMQYLVWPLAFAYLINPWTASAYNFAASAFIVLVYDHWNNARPWNWYEARGPQFWPREFVLMTITWLALAAVVASGFLLLRRREPTSVDHSTVTVPDGTAEPPSRRALSQTTQP